MTQAEEKSLRIINDASLATSEREATIHYLRDHPSPAVAEQLVQTLEDDDPGIRWAAAMTLAAYGNVGLRPLLQALTQPTIDARLREGAHRVLSHNTSSQVPGPRVQELLNALQGPGANVATMTAAMNLLRTLD